MNYTKDEFLNEQSIAVREAIKQGQLTEYLDNVFEMIYNDGKNDGINSVHRPALTTATPLSILLESPDEVVRRNAMSIFKRLNKH